MAKSGEIKENKSAETEIDYSKTEATVCYLVKDGKVLLVEKGRNIGKGMLVGVGGRQEENDKTIEETSNREVEEEIGVKITSMRRGGFLEFVFPHNPKFSQKVTAFVADSWEGDPKVTEEAKSIEWFNINELPLEKMWPDNSIWLSFVLSGEEIKGRFIIDKNNQVKEYTLKIEK